jgi:hypothetical protein
MNTEKEIEPIHQLKGATFDRTDYAKLYRDTPLAAPADSRNRELLAPGTAVKTSDDKICGKVHTNEGETCIVIGHGWEDWDSERFVWRGTHFDFIRTWLID